jgi:hypothetical protein
MKGPGLRVDLDVRRTWRCPRCGRERRAAADVTALTCSCAPDNPRMQLVESQRRVRPEPKPLDLVLNIDLDAPDADASDVSSEAVPIESEPAQTTTDVSAGRRAPRRDGDRHEAPSTILPPAPEVASEAAADTARNELPAVEHSTSEVVSAVDADDFGVGLADAPSPPVPENPGP